MHTPSANPSGSVFVGELAAGQISSTHPNTVLNGMKSALQATHTDSHTALTSTTLSAMALKTEFKELSWWGQRKVVSHLSPLTLECLI
jgi:hypothetical protein